ncbi:hypothetical protein JCM19037_4335 [Geomicrobium sp. JCM 19037]|uniref:SDR family oxidoreductase n=1 Tax=Geomicrobium sp. JCM 19037 TaxID=1460634 RepID=UPI00045F310D|nr:SDR family oxidoreductase [Geomicrobium sp. JCM 19037]GAK05805.1 hypothetical protein JCM19037_4335 [Geomicrobium sp. JCM 19037]
MGLGERRLGSYKNKIGAKHSIGLQGGHIDVANTVLFLASDEAQFITGAQLAVDDGYTAK